MSLRVDNLSGVHHTVNQSLPCASHQGKYLHSVLYNGPSDLSASVGVHTTEGEASQCTVHSDLSASVGVYHPEGEASQCTL